MLQHFLRGEQEKMTHRSHAFFTEGFAAVFSRSIWSAVNSKPSALRFSSTCSVRLPQ